MPTNATSKNFGESRKALKRTEIYLTNETYNILAKEAERQRRSTKNYIEVLLTTKSLILKGKK